MIEPQGAAAPSTSRGVALRFLRRHTAFRALWATRALMLVGNSVGLIALLLYTAGQTGTGTAVALLLLAGDLAPTVFSPLSGALSDRLDRRRLMALSAVLSAVAAGMVALVAPPLPVVLALVGLRSTMGQLAMSSSLSAMPDLVGIADVQEANTALGLGTQGLDFAGPLFTAALLPIAGLRGTLLFAAALLCLAAAPLGWLPPLPAVQRSGTSSTLRADAMEGLRLLWKDPAIRLITLGFVAVVACTGVDDVALVFLAEHTLGAHATAASLLYAAAGAGLLAGYAALSCWGSTLPLPAMLVAGYALNGGGNLLTGCSWAVPPAFAMQALRGVGLSLSDVANTTLIQRLAPAGMAGRVFSNVYGAVGVAAAASYILGGALLDLTNPRIVFIVAGGGGLLAAAFLWRALPARLPFSDGSLKTDDPTAAG